MDILKRPYYFLSNIERSMSQINHMVSRDGGNGHSLESVWLKLRDASSHRSPFDSCWTPPALRHFESLILGEAEAREISK